MGLEHSLLLKTSQRKNYSIRKTILSDLTELGERKCPTLALCRLPSGGSEITNSNLI